MDNAKESRVPAFSLDLRALALWRIGIGAVVLLDIVLRLRDLHVFYGDYGVLSRELFLKQSWQPPVYHLFLSSGSTGGLLALFAVWAAAAFCLMVGYKARWAALITWYFAVSIQLRNPMVLDGGDDLVRVLLFWMPFLPITARWSWEARQNPQWRQLPETYRSVASIGLVLQYFLFYLFAALLKNGEDWIKTGDALYYTLSVDQFTTSFGRFLSQYPDLLRPATFMALGLEYTLAITLLLGGRWTWARTAFFCLGVGFHLAIASMLKFGVFMPIAIAGLLVFFPSRWLDRWSRPEIEPEVLTENLPTAYRLGWPLKAFAAIMSAMLIVFNVYSIQHVHKIPQWTRPVMEWTYEQQHWHFFAPVALREDGWYIFEVTLEDGTVLDGWENGPPENVKPLSVSSRFPNQRWRRWMQNLTQIDIPDKESWRSSTLAWAVRHWKAANPDKRAQVFRLLFMREVTPDLGKAGVVETVVLAEQNKERSGSSRVSGDGGKKQAKDAGVPHHVDSDGHPQGPGL